MILVIKLLEYKKNATKQIRVQYLQRTQKK